MKHFIFTTKLTCITSVLAENEDEALKLVGKIDPANSSISDHPYYEGWKLDGVEEWDQEEFSKEQ